MRNSEFRTAGQAKLRVAQALSHPLMGRAVRRLLGERVRNRGLTFDTRGFSDEVVATLFWQIYESSEIRFIRRFFVEEAVAVDLGASLGVTAAHALSVMKRRGKLIAVEPNPLLIPILNRTLRDHSGDRDVTVVRAAIRSGVDEAGFALNERTDSSKLAANSGLRVRATGLASIVADHGLESYSLICDIEGAEASIMWDEPEALDPCRKAMFELHGDDSEIRAMIDRLGALGLCVVEAHGPVVACVRGRASAEHT